MVSMSQLEEDAAPKNKTGLYGAWFDASVADGLAYLKMASPYVIEFAAKANGEVRGLNDHGALLLSELAKCNQHHAPSMNTALSMIELEA
ncbi:MAG: hypothetical protein DI551_12100, partial [Micavibrio aeruginosavorus]